MHSRRADVPYQSEIPYLWLKNCQYPLNIAGKFQNFNQSSQKALGLVDFKDRGIFVLWIWGLMNQFLKDHQLNKAEFGVTDGSISV